MKMGSTYIVCCVLAIALNQHVVVEGATCQSTQRKPCQWDSLIPDITEAKCDAVAGGCCNWCPGITQFKKKCQTDNFACLVASPKMVPGTFATSALCEVEGIYCGGDTSQKCIYDEPLLKFCYKPASVTACPIAHTTESACQSGGTCFWCGQGIASRINKCFAVPDDVSCGMETCCKNLHCGPHVFTKSDCLARGCHCCSEGDDVICNLGTNTDAAPTCLSDNELCIWDGVTTASMTEQNCQEFNKYCAWCPSQTEIHLRCQTVDASCLVAEQWVLPAADAAACTTAGGIYCHGDCAKTCIRPEPADKICFQPQDTTRCANEATTTRGDCIAAGCVWCDGTGVIVRRDKCWAMPCEAECGPTTAPANCCEEHRCMDGNDFDETICTDTLGCEVCIPTAPAAGPKLCVYK